MPDVVSAVLMVASVVAAVATILGALWWLLRPRVEAYLSRLVTGLLEVVAARLDDHSERLHALERTRDPVDLGELVDLIELVQRYRPTPPGWPPPADKELSS